MPDKKSKTYCVFLDTSFLISLVDSARQNHPVAKSYFDYFRGNGVSMVVSTIVVSEYMVKAELPASVVGCADIYSFDYRDAARSAAIYNVIAANRDASDKRDVCKADSLLIAHAVENGAYAIVTDDKNTLAKYVKRISPDGDTLRVIPLWEPYNEGIASPEGSPTML